MKTLSRCLTSQMQWNIHNVLVLCLLLAPVQKVYAQSRHSGGPIVAAKSSDSALYQKLLLDIQASIQKGPEALRILQAFNDAGKSINEIINEAVENAIDPHHQYGSIIEFLPENGWAVPLYEYAEGGENDETPLYETVNRELGDINPDSAKTTAWVKAARKAMEHLPRFEGITFRGTRLSPENIERFYPLGGLAKDSRFISTSVSPGIAFRFAQGGKDGNLNINNLAVIFVIKGKTGRPVSNFANMHQGEAEILFANGTRMQVEAKGPIFKDPQLGRTQIIILNEL